MYALTLLATVCPAIAAQVAALSRDSVATNIIGPYETAQVSITYLPMRWPGGTGAGLPWSPSADGHAVLATLLPLQVGTLHLDAGRYQIWILGTDDHATLILNRDVDASSGGYDSTQDAGRVALNATPVDSPSVQTTIGFGTVRIAPDTLGVVFIDRTKARNHIETTRVTETSGARRFLVIYAGRWKWTVVLDAPGGS